MRQTSFRWLNKNILTHQTDEQRRLAHSFLRAKMEHPTQQDPIFDKLKIKRRRRDEDR